MYFFNYSKTKKLADIASEHVNQFRYEKTKRLTEAKSYLVGTASFIRKKIIDASKEGKLSVSLNFPELNEQSQFGNFDYLFTDHELDELIISVTDFVVKEGFGHTTNGHSVTITWPDPHKEFTFSSQKQIEISQEGSECEQDQIE